MRLSHPLAADAAGSRSSGTSARGRQGGRGLVRSPPPHPTPSSASGSRVTLVPPALPAEKPGWSVVFSACGRGFPPVPSRPLVITGAMNKKKKPFLGMPAPLGYVPGLGRG